MEVRPVDDGGDGAFAVWMASMGCRVASDRYIGSNLDLYPALHGTL